MSTTPRPYSSPLRERQALQTRELILGTLTDLLDTRRADEISTRDLAQAAGVSERTVYRHFPDRDALISGLGDQLVQVGGPDAPHPDIATVDDLATTAVELMTMLERHRGAARAEALFNADPRRYTAATQANSALFERAVAEGFPHLDEREVRQLTAVLRCLLSAQAWLRMREEFGIPGDESGPVVAWVLETVFAEVRRGGRPPAAPDSRGPEGSLNR